MKHGPYGFEIVSPGIVEITNTSGTKFKVMVSALESFLAEQLRAEIHRELDTAEARDVLHGRWRVRP